MASFPWYYHNLKTLGKLNGIQCNQSKFFETFGHTVRKPEYINFVKTCLELVIFLPTNVLIDRCHMILLGLSLMKYLGEKFTIFHSGWVTMGIFGQLKKM